MGVENMVTRFLSAGLLLFMAGICGGYGAEVGTSGATKPDVADYQRGIKAAEAKDYSAAAMFLKRAAGLGNPNAEYALGNLFVKGLGVARNYGRAAHWYRRAAGAGDPRSAAAIGSLYRKGHGLKLNLSKAALWYAKSAVLGDNQAADEIQAICRDRRFAVADGTLAWTWLKKSAAAGDCRAMHCIAQCYARGLLVRTNEDRAIFWCHRAALAGSGRAMFDLGMIYEFGLEGLPRDIHKALSWYEKGAAAGCPRAMVELGNLYSRGDGIAQSKQDARIWYRLAMKCDLNAASLGDGTAMLDIGLLYDSGYGVPRDKKTAALWWRKAAAAGNRSAQKILGMNKMLLPPGLHLPPEGMFALGYHAYQGRNYGKAMRFWKKSAAAGDMDAIYGIGLLYAQGLGVPRNDKEAILWFKKAASAGYAPAQEALKKIEAAPATQNDAKR